MARPVAWHALAMAALLPPLYCLYCRPTWAVLVMHASSLYAYRVTYRTRAVDTVALSLSLSLSMGHDLPSPPPCVHLGDRSALVRARTPWHAWQLALVGGGGTRCGVFCVRHNVESHTTSSSTLYQAEERAVQLLQLGARIMNMESDDGAARTFPNRNERRHLSRTRSSEADRSAVRS